MLHPSVCFPDYYELASRSVRTADAPQSTANAARAERPRPDFQRIVLPSGCVLFRLRLPREKAFGMKPKCRQAD
jgi:hypothetical protein